MRLWQPTELRQVKLRMRGRLLQRRGPATVNDPSPRLVRVLRTSHVATLDDRSRRRPVAAGKTEQDSVAVQTQAPYRASVIFHIMTSALKATAIYFTIKSSLQLNRVCRVTRRRCRRPASVRRTASYLHINYYTD